MVKTVRVEANRSSAGLFEAPRSVEDWLLAEQQLEEDQRFRTSRLSGRHRQALSIQRCCKFRPSEDLEGLKSPGGSAQKCPPNTHSVSEQEFESKVPIFREGFPVLREH